MFNLKGIFRRIKNSEKKYEKGLAYLNGDGVEYDPEKAAELIISAAEDGVIEAMRTLAGMYRKGEGVIRDYDKEVEWLEKALDCCKNSSEDVFEKPAPDYSEKLARMKKRNELIKDLRNYEKR